MERSKFEINLLPQLRVRQFQFQSEPVCVTLLIDGGYFRYALIAVLKGTIRLDTSELSFECRSHEICLVRTVTLVRADSTDLLKLFIIEFSDRFASEAVYSIHAKTFTQLFSHNFSKIVADTIHLRIIKQLLVLLHKHHNYYASPNSEIICQLTFNLLLSCAGELQTERVQEDCPTASYKVAVMMKFLRMVQHYGLREHSVKFYAGQLCMSQGNLTRIIKEVTGKVPKFLIEENIVDKAKITLDENSLLNIYLLAEELGFKSSSAFINFFKFHTSMTPNEYRNRKMR